MRNSEAGVAALTVIGAILIVLGGLAVAMAPQIMNSSEVNTLRGIGAGVGVLGIVLLAVGMSKKN